MVRRKGPQQRWREGGLTKYTGNFVFTLTRAQAEALLQGKVVAFDIGGREYAGFMLVQDPPAHEQSQ